MTEADRLLLSSKGETVQISFRMPRILKQALQQFVYDNVNFPTTKQQEVIFYLTNETLFNAFRNKFIAVRMGEAPVFGSMNYASLPSYNVSPALYERIQNTGTHPTAVFVPKIMYDFLDYMRISLGTELSVNQLYPKLIDKILINALSAQIDYLFATEDAEKKQLKENQPKLF